MLYQSTFGMGIGRRSRLSGSFGRTSYLAGEPCLFSDAFQLRSHFVICADLPGVSTVVS